MAQMDATREPIRLVLADVDGTLVTPAKELTDQTVAAVKDLRAAGVEFAVVSGRPPKGMAMLIEPLELSTPLAAFNGGMIVDPALRPLAKHTIAPELVAPIIELLEAFSLDVWVYRDGDWCVRDPNGPHVARERETVRFEPTVVADYADRTSEVVKIVGVSDDTEAVAKAGEVAASRFGKGLSAARSQPYYLDITHPHANKGFVVGYLAERLGVGPQQIATIGDMPNDTLMFARSGLSIAMGNAGPQVQAQADVVTDSNGEEGFAKAVWRFVLGGEGKADPGG